MSRTRLEKDPGRFCGFEWGGVKGCTCSHVCRRPLADHGPEHVCCAAQDGRIGVMEAVS